MRLRPEQMQALIEVNARERALQHARKWAAGHPHAHLDSSDGSVHEATPNGRTQIARFGPHGLTELETFCGRRYGLGHDDAGHIVEASVSGVAGASGSLTYRIRYAETSTPSELWRGDDRLLALRSSDGRGDGEHALEIEYADGAVERLEYTNGALVRTVDAAGGALTLERDAQGAVRRVVDPRGNATAFERDPLDPAGVTLVYADGSRETCRSESDETQSVHVDGALVGRVRTDGDREHVLFADGHSMAIEWDDDRPLRGTNDATTVELEYDDQGRITAEVQGATRIEYGYDDAGNLTQIETSDGQRQRFEWDADGYLARASDGGDEAFEFQYDTAGLLTWLRAPNGVETRARLELGARSHEEADPERPTPVDVANLVTTAPGLSAPLLEQELALDLRGRIVYARQGERRRAYHYDPAGRLASARDPISNDAHTYAWDASGNRVQAGAESARFDVRNRIESQGAEVFRHDALGRLVQRRGRTPYEYRYDGQGNLRAVHRAGVEIASYAYDAFGRRVRKQCGERVTHFLWAGRQLLREVHFERGQRVERRDYLCVPAERHPLGVRIDGELHCYHLDSTGTPLALTNARARVVWRARFGDFGETLEEQGVVRQPLRHLGQYCDEETGLHYNVFRYYDPRLGRYLTPDPLRFRGGSHNFYTYANGDPINQRDPDGHLVFLAALAVVGVAAVVGGLIGGAIAAATAEEGKRAAAFAKGFGWGALAGAVGAAVPLAGAAAGLGTAAIAAASLTADGIVSGIEACAESGWDTGTFAKAAAISVGTTVATLGLAKIPAVRRAVTALGDKLQPAQDAIGEGLSKTWNRIKAPFRREAPAPDMPSGSRVDAVPPPVREEPDVDFDQVKDKKCKSECGDPVDIASGEVHVAQTDFVLRGHIPVEWQRRYRSHGARVGICGLGWETPADARLELSENGEAVFHDGGPGAAVFPTLPFIGPVREKTAGARLSSEPDQLVVTQPGGLRHVFRAARRGDRELLVERIEDPFGNQLRFERSGDDLLALVESSGRRLAVTSRDGLVRELRLEAADRSESRLLVRYEYDDERRLVAAIDPVGRRYAFRYEEGRIVERRDPLGRTFHYEYEDEYEDARGSQTASAAATEAAAGDPPRSESALPGAVLARPARCIRTRSGDGLLDYQIEYTASPRATRYTDSLGHVWISELDASGFIVAQVDPDGGRTEFVYDKGGRTTAVIAPGGRVTTWEYDDQGNVLCEVLPDGARHRYAYDGAGRLIEYTDPNGQTWRQEWSPQHRLTRRVAPDGATWTLGYGARGELSRIADPLGHAQTFRYDEHGWLTERELANGSTWTYTYDLAGNPIELRDPLGARTTFAYDECNRLRARIDPMGARDELRYDGAGNLVQHRDAEGRVTELEYSGLDQLTRKLQPDGSRIEYAYDTEGRLSEVRDRRGRRYQLLRDTLGRIVEEIDYWGARRQFTYDAGGQLVAKRDELGRETQFTRDPLGRLLELVTEDGTESFTYDAAGNPIEARNATGSVRKHYDAVGRLIREEQPQGEVRFAYDRAGRLVERTSSVGHRLRYAWDAVDQVCEIRIDDRPPIRLEHDAAGRITREVLNGTLTRTYRHDANGRRTFQELRAQGAPLGSSSYRYTPTGELGEWTSASAGSVRLRYDPLGQLASFRMPGSAIDEAVSQLDEHLASPSEADLARTWSRRGIDFGFDHAGRLRTKSGRGHDLELHWDTTDRLRSTRAGTEDPCTYAYDAFSRRTAKTQAERETTFLWEGPRLLAERRPDGSHREYVFYPGTFVPLAWIDETSHLYFYDTDPVGLPREVHNERGHTLWRADYDGTGRLRDLPVAHIDQPLRFQGQYHDPETGLHYNLNRYYDPDLAHFVSKDPLGLAAGEDLYACAPNPWSWIDPLGLISDDVCKDIGTGPDTKVNRIGGSAIENLKLKPAEEKLSPPGISVLLDVTPQVASQQMKDAFPKATRLHEAAKTVGASTTERIRKAGFDVIPDPTNKFPNHGRLIHPDGVSGFTEENLKNLLSAFDDVQV